MLGVVIAGTYKLTQVIHIGSSCALYVAKDLRNNTEYAAKVETMSTCTPLLNKEYRVYRAMHSNARLIGIPVIRYFHNQGSYTALIMDRFGSPLQAPSSRNPRLLPLHQTLRVGMDVIRILARVHNSGFLHLNINPTNIVFDDTDHPSTVRLVDFGFAEGFLSCDTREHRRFEEDIHAVGTIRFASVCTHAQLTRSRIDDLESLVYVLIFVHLGALPWDGYINEEVSRKDAHQPTLVPDVNFRNILFHDIGMIKGNIRVEELCAGMPAEVAQYAQYVRDLEFGTKPNYDYLVKLLEAALKNIPN